MADDEERDDSGPRRAAEMGDLALLDRWRGGDSTAGSALFERHFDALCRFFRNKLAAGDGVDDLIQRTMLALVESRDRFRGEASFRTYLFTIARHELYAHLKRSGREQARFDPLVHSVHDHGPSPTTILAQRKEQRMLLEALRRVPLELQVVLELYYWEGIGTAELGELLELPQGTVKTRLMRARERLRASLSHAPAGEIPSDDDGLDAWARSLRALVVA